MNAKPIPSEESVKQAIGHEFPGGDYAIAHWENFLLTDCTGAEILPNGQVHPVALFHVPILGSGTTIGEMFALGQAETDFSIGIESYTWDMPKPLYEDVKYHITGKILDVRRQTWDNGKPYDRIVFEFQMHEPDGGDLAAKITVVWTYRRGIS